MPDVSVYSIAEHGLEAATVLAMGNDRGFAMKRDDDYLRELLIAIQDSDQWLVKSAMTDSSDEEDARRHFHLLMLMDAGLLADHTGRGMVFRLTDAGQTFANQIREDSNWRVVKSTAATVAGYSIGMLADIAKAYAIEVLREAGLPL